MDFDTQSLIQKTVSWVYRLRVIENYFFLWN